MWFEQIYIPYIPCVYPRPKLGPYVNLRFEGIMRMSAALFIFNQAILSFDAPQGAGVNIF